MPYAIGALVIDAAQFVPQSRKPFFLVAVRKGAPVPDPLVGAGPCALWHPKPLVSAQARLPAPVRDAWLWWRPPAPAARNVGLAEVIDSSLPWDPPPATAYLLGLTDAKHRAKLEEAKRSGARVIASACRRTRWVDGDRRQRAELRFDGLANAVRTAGGGSSIQFLVAIDGEDLRSRRLSPREAARLMGLPDDYRLPALATRAMDLIGDGVAVPVVRFLAAHLLEPIIAGRTP